MIKKLLSLVIIATISLLLLNGCTKEINYSIGFVDSSTGHKEHGLESFIKTFDEWSSIRNERHYLVELDDKYDQQFFKNNSLIIYAFSRATDGGTTQIVKISKKRNQLTVDVDFTSGYMDVVSYGIIIIEVSKADVSNATKVKIVEKLKI